MAVVAAVIAGLCLWSAAGAAQAAGAFSNWAVVVVAGDWHADGGAPTEVFDNARRDLAKAFVKAGFSPDNILQFSVRPERYPAETTLKSDAETIFAEFGRLTTQATGGCLIYFTTHGAPATHDNPAGIGVNGQLWGADMMSPLVDASCGNRPTVVVLSACYSGALIPAVSGPNRMVLTAARSDRSSFGCSAEDRYTFFDNCVLQQLPLVSDFLGLGRAVTACIAMREEDLQLMPPSEPQTNIGALLQPLLSKLAFTKPPPMAQR